MYLDPCLVEMGASQCHGVPYDVMYVYLFFFLLAGSIQIEKPSDGISDALESSFQQPDLFKKVPVVFSLVFDDDSVGR